LLATTGTNADATLEEEAAAEDLFVINFNVLSDLYCNKKEILLRSRFCLSGRLIHLENANRNTALSRGDDDYSGGSNRAMRACRRRCVRKLDDQASEREAAAGFGYSA